MNKLTLINDKIIKAIITELRNDSCIDKLVVCFDISSMTDDEQDLFDPALLKDAGTRLEIPVDKNACRVLDLSVSGIVTAKTVIADSEVIPVISATNYVERIYAVSGNEMVYNQTFVVLTEIE